MGDIRDEIIAFYMNQAPVLQSERVVSKSVSTAEQLWWKKRFSGFEKRVDNFESFEEATNVALLLCNMGRHMQICAQEHCGTGDEFNHKFFTRRRFVL